MVSARIFDSHLSSLPIPHLGISVPSFSRVTELQPLAAKLVPQRARILRALTRLPTVGRALLAGSNAALEAELSDAGITDGLYWPGPEPLNVDRPAIDDILWLPTAGIDADSRKPTHALDLRFETSPFRALLVHPTQIGLGPESTLFDSLWKWASSRRVVVVLSLEASLIFKSQPLESFSHWFERHPSTRFLIHFPHDYPIDALLEFVTPYPELHLTTGSFPTETLSEILLRIHPNRLLFGSNWPFSGMPIHESLSRVRALTETRRVSEADRDAILFENANQLFGGLE